MANEKVPSALRDLPTRILSIPISDRRQLINDISTVIRTRDVNPAIVKGVCKILGTTLFKYDDAQSKCLIRNLIVEMLEIYNDLSVESILLVLRCVLKKDLSYATMDTSTDFALEALNLLNLVISNTSPESPRLVAERIRIIDIQSNLYERVLMSSSKLKKEDFLCRLFELWKNYPEYGRNLISGIKTESSFKKFLLAVALIEYLDKSKSYSLRAVKETLIPLFVKFVIESKSKPSNRYVAACEPLLGVLSNDDLMLIFPILQRALLRNPENVIEIAGIIIESITADVNPYSLEIGNLLIQHVYCKREETRQTAIAALKILSKKCTAISTVQYLLRKVFDILDGKEGKINIVEYRVNLIQVAGHLSYSNIPQATDSAVLKEVVDRCSRALHCEIHEKVLCRLLEMLTLWTRKIEGILPDFVIDIIIKGLKLKSTTPVVRYAYLQWLLSTLNSGQLSHHYNLISVLMTLYSQLSDTTGGIAQISEKSCITCILLKIDAPSENNGVFWNTLFDVTKLDLFTDKVRNAASMDTLCHIGMISERLLITYMDRLKGNPECLTRTIVCNITHTSLHVRNHAIELLRNVINARHSAQIIQPILTHFEEQLLLFKGQFDVHVGEYFKEISYSIVEALEAFIITGDMNLSEKRNLAFQLLSLTHEPLIGKHNPFVWESIILKKFKIDPKDFILTNLQYIVHEYIYNCKVEEKYSMVIRSIVRLCPTGMLPPIISHLVQILNEVGSNCITDAEYLIYSTHTEEINSKNNTCNTTSTHISGMLKREKKPYNRKGHIETSQVRKDLDDKQKNEDPLACVQVSQQQRDAINNQNERDRRIKLRVAEIANKAAIADFMLRAACDGSPVELSKYSNSLLASILSASKSLANSELLVELYYFLHSICMPDKPELAQKMAIATIRLIDPPYRLIEDWTCGQLMQSTEDIIQILCKSILNTDNIDSCNMDTRVESLLSAPAFCYAFQFLKNALSSKVMQMDEEYSVRVIKLIEAHSRVRVSNVSDEHSDIFHPKYLPHSEIFSLLVSVLESNCSKQVENCAVAAICEMSESCSGKKFCCSASVEEIDTFLEALLSSSNIQREVSLKALQNLLGNLNLNILGCNFLKKVSSSIWIAKQDTCPENSVLALSLWNLLNLPEPASEDILSYISHPNLFVQHSAASSLKLLLTNSSCVEKLINNLLSTYREHHDMLPPKLDQFERVVEPAVDRWEARRGVAVTFSHITPLLSTVNIETVMGFMVSTALGDRNEMVRQEMLKTSLKIVEFRGNESTVKLINIFETFLDKTPNSRNFDSSRQSVVILMGTLARHLNSDDCRIQPIVQRLIAALSTPSQQVQEAVATCLPYLVPCVRHEANAMVKKLLNLLVKSEKYGERRGAAYGLAGIVKGLGILSLKQLEIMSKLTTCIQEKKNWKSREGALFAFEILCSTLGRLFEPYIVHVLPHLLQCFGDSSQYVRQAADETAKVVMSKLSAHGVKLVLPSLLEGLDKNSWRTKIASIELLGAMAFCAPKQLSSCLPSIVPKLIEVLGDSHAKVQEAGAQALKLIGSVIKNPEIQTVVPLLLSALEEPGKNAPLCLQSLLSTKFVHFIDAASLALIMPVVQRAFSDRSTETRKMAAQIIGNMYSLTDQKDLVQYLPYIVPGLKASLLDPVPEVRAISARALGAMVKGLGESSYEDLLPWLMETLTSEAGSVDRSGAAQGLAEVVGGLGVEKLHKLMPEVIATAERSDISPHVKDGYIMIFIYMPGPFLEEFTQYIGQIINPILKALADENEYVRETALKAGQRIVTLYAESAISLLLPELEKGIFDDNWRIRYSSVQLLGDLLYRVSGVSGKMTTETSNEDDNFGSEHSNSAIINVLGEERRNRVLSGLYIARSDVSIMVKQAALHVWKIVVANTPRTLREILATLFNFLLGCLASTSFDKKQVAARTLGDLVRKLGERVLPEIIPILERGLNSPHSDQRQGVCIGLSEIITSTSKEMVVAYINSLVPTVRKALSDPLPEVRKVAAKTFDSLHSTIGYRALDEILPQLMEQLSSDDEFIIERSLDGLRQVMSIKSKVVLPYLIPQLTSSTVNTKALSILVSAAGDALTKYLPKILFAMLEALAQAQGSSTELQEYENCEVVILSVADETGIRTILDVLMTSANSDSLAIRRFASGLLSAFCTYSEGDYSQYIPSLFRCFIRLMVEQDKIILNKSWEGLAAIIKTLTSEDQIRYVSDVRQAVRFASSDIKERELPGLALPKGISPLIPIFREAILNGLPEDKQNAAEGLGELILLTNPKSLQSSVIHITGPLIRILGDRFNSGIKAAVLETLTILLHKVGVMLKQFLPQLQTTFVKSIYDTNRTVRLRAGSALAELITIHPRAYPLFMEILTGVKNSDDPFVRETMLHALRCSLNKAGSKMCDPMREQIYEALLNMIYHPEDNTRCAAGGCLASLLKYTPQQQVDECFKSYVLFDNSPDYFFKHGSTVVIFASLKECPSRIINPCKEKKIIDAILACITCDNASIACNGIRAAVYLLIHCITLNKTYPTGVLECFARSINHSNNDVKQLSAKSCSYLSTHLSENQASTEIMRHIIPMLIQGTKEKNGYVKSNSELSLISVLRLKDGMGILEKVCDSLDPGAKDLLKEVASKLLKKVIRHLQFREEELDNTLVT